MVFAGISIEKEKRLRQTMRRLKVFEKDIKETFVRSSGPGGQNVNKVATCVVLLHHPSGIQVKRQSARTQGANRYAARCLLLAKIEEKYARARQAVIDQRQKTKRQNRKRSKASKEKILEGKRMQSQKKSARRKITVAEV